MAIKVQGTVIINDNRSIVNSNGYNGYTPANAARVISTSGIASGGGNLTSNRTINVPGTNLGSSGSGNSRTITSSTGSNTTISFTAGDFNAVPTSRTISTSGIATGGGNLGSNRTISVPGTNLGSSGSGNSRTITSSTGSNTTISFTAGDFNAVPTSRQVNSGDGLDGGGNLGSNRTLSVDGTVVRTSGNQVISDIKTFSDQIRISGVRIENSGQDGSLDIRTTDNGAPYIMEVKSSGGAGRFRVDHNTTLLWGRENGTWTIGSDRVLTEADLDNVGSSWEVIEVHEITSNTPEVVFNNLGDYKDIRVSLISVTALQVAGGPGGNPPAISARFRCIQVGTSSGWLDGNGDYFRISGTQSEIYVHRNSSSGHRGGTVEFPEFNSSNLPVKPVLQYHCYDNSAITGINTSQPLTRLRVFDDLSTHLTGGHIIVFGRL